MQLIFFQTEQKIESQSGCLSTIQLEVSAESNDSGVKT